MNRTSGQRHHRVLFFALLLALASPRARADQWTAPTSEELSMTSQPQVPGASAVYLDYEETGKDDLHDFSVYARIKVLSEAGKDRGNVELKYASYRDAHFTISDIQGRTIHSDGTIIPFTGKPYEKLIEKANGLKVMAKVFSLPDVQIGSIIEYRYSLRYDDAYFVPPSWYVQGDLFVRKAHYAWWPTTRDLANDRGMINSIAWFPILPIGTKIERTEMPGGPFNGPQQKFDLNVSNVPPAPHEDYMPPISSLTYRVLFYYTTYRKGDEFWTQEGKVWNKERDKFIGPGHAVSSAVQQLVSASDTPDQKLRKIYAFVMQLENTSYTREHTAQEDKAHGFKEVHNTDDILERKRGNNDQITELFVAMARAAGMKAYVAAVTNRDKNMFIKFFYSFSQFDDYVAIVNVNDKEEYFDPGSRYCPYQHLEWKHSRASGIRQTDKGTDFVETPIESYADSRTQRVADLIMDEHGAVTGAVKMTYIGDSALAWRQRSLVGDTTSLERELHDSIEHLVPPGMDIKVVSIDRLADYEQPLTVNFSVSGPIGAPTGRRLFVPADLFVANGKPLFSAEKRDIAVYFNYPHMIQDAVRIKYPANFVVESSPASDKFQFKNLAGYNLTSQSAANSITFRRNFSLGEILYLPQEYSDLRSFYSRISTKDQENIVLTVANGPKPTTAAN